MENNKTTIEIETENPKTDTDTTKLPDDTQNNGHSKLVGGI